MTASPDDAAALLLPASRGGRAGGSVVPGDPRSTATGGIPHGPAAPRARRDRAHARRRARRPAARRALAARCRPTATRPAAAARSRPGPAAGEVDDTRPVTRDWLQRRARDRTAAPEPPTSAGRRRPTTTPAPAVDADRPPVAAATTAPADTGPPTPPSDLPARPTPRSTARRAGDTRRRAASARGRRRRRRPRGPGGAAAPSSCPPAPSPSSPPLYGVDLLLSSGDVPRSTVVAGVDIGGLSPAAAARPLEEQLGARGHRRPHRRRRRRRGDPLPRAAGLTPGRRGAPSTPPTTSR